MIKISIEDKKYQLSGFQWKVLSAVMSIPLGETRSYQWVAKAIGHPKAVRAVGTALRKNPFPLIIPCHRVVRSDGTPGFYCGRSDGSKEKLLRLEQEILKNMKNGIPSHRRSKISQKSSSHASGLSAHMCF